MKKCVAIFIAIISVVACLAFSGCQRSYSDWHDKQVEQGMENAKDILGR